MQTSMLKNPFPESRIPSSGVSSAMNCMVCSLAILVNFAPLYHSHVNTFAAAGALIDRFQGNLFDQLFNPLSGFF
jgi:hypothetical protein